MRLLLQAAVDLMQAGAVPSISDVAEAAGVSRATAYRYFPSQAAMVSAVVDEALGPILEWRSTASAPQDRVRSLLETALPRLGEFEATFRAALMLSLDHWARQRSGTLSGEPLFTRGHRIKLLGEAAGPLREQLDAAEFERLTKALSLVFGVEALVVLKDIWGSDAEEVDGVLFWAAGALIRAALAEAASKGKA